MPSTPPKLAAFPKAFMDALCVDGSMSLESWIDLSGQLDVDGLEFYAGFKDLENPRRWPAFRRRVEDQGRHIAMMCCSPDFTQADPQRRQEEIDKEKGWIDLTRELGGGYCRILSGQRRPEIGLEEGLAYCVECFQACLDHARQADVVLVLENHYKDNYWRHPEFAQKMEVFCELVRRIESSYFGVNYDPSNALIAGEDPLELLERVKSRVKTMHASDRYLAGGNLDDLKAADGSAGYAEILRHGEIGKGLNDYDAIFSALSHAGFSGWISIEDGVEGMDQLRRSAKFLREKVARHWA